MKHTYSVPLSLIVEKLKLKTDYTAADIKDIRIHSSDVHRPGLQLTGFYEYFDSSRIQIFGKMETTYLTGYPQDKKKEVIDRFMAQKMPAVIFCNGAKPDVDILEAAEKYGVTILETDDGTSDLIAALIGLLNEQLAERITRHGVLVEVYGEGLLLLGESGVGKSETAIELLKRGHRLIADDAVEIRRVSPTMLLGMAPELIRYYVELRGIGVIDVRNIFGIGAVKPWEKINLIVNLEPWKEGMLYDRLGVGTQYTNIMGIDVPTVTIPVKPGRNLAIILEVAAMNNRQRKMGYNAALAFTEQINKHFDEQMAMGKNNE